MEFISSGNSELDALLGGGFIRNSSILFLIEAGGMGEIVALNLFTNRLSTGDSGFIIDLDIPPRRVREWFKFKKLDIDKFEENEQFFIIDGFSKMYGEHSSEEKYVIDKPKDIVHINAYIAELTQMVEQHKPNVFSLMFSSNLFLSRKQDLDKVINFIYKTRVMLSQFGLCAFVFDKGMLDEKSLRTLEHAFDYVLDFKVSEKDRKFQKYLRVVKSPSNNYLDEFVPYEIRPGGFALSTRTIEEFDYIKQQLKMLDEGVLELLGSRVIILDPNFYSMIFTKIMNEYGYEEASEFMYQQGKKGIPLVKNFREQFKITDLKKAVDSFARLIELRGNGKLETIFDEKINGYRFRLINSPVCSYFKGLGKTAGWATAGLFAGAFEIYTGDSYECEEVKCIAKGDDCCEFVVKRSKS
ncbi:MAG: V4R domain-containing protein [Candidatus Freyarchaeum deiterrae]